MSLFTKISAAAILTASAAFAPAAAAQPPAEPSEVEAPDDQEDPSGIGTRIIVYGAAKDPASAGMPAATEDESVPELPIVYEDEAETAKVSPQAGAALPASSAR